MRLKIVFGLALFVVSISYWGCDPVQKLAKSNNIAEKDSAAVRYYEKGKYESAAFLMEELVGLYRGQPREKEIRYMYANCKYRLKEYVSAAYYMEDFATKYPRDERSEEMAFNSAYCYFLLTDPEFLDQQYTYKALNRMQAFIDLNPVTDRAAECNDIIKALRERLAIKDYKQCELYYRLGHYKAAVTSYNTFISEFPDSEFREEAQFFLFKSGVGLGNKSVQEKRLERYSESIILYEKFVDKFPNSKFVKEAENLLQGVETQIKKLNKDKNG